MKVRPREYCDLENTHTWAFLIAAPVCSLLQSESQHAEFARAFVANESLTKNADIDEWLHSHTKTICHKSHERSNGATTAEQ